MDGFQLMMELPQRMKCAYCPASKFLSFVRADKFNEIAPQPCANCCFLYKHTHWTDDSHIGAVIYETPAPLIVSNPPVSNVHVCAGDAIISLTIQPIECSAYVVFRFQGPVGISQPIFSFHMRPNVGLRLVFGSPYLYTLDMSYARLQFVTSKPMQHQPQVTGVYLHLAPETREKLASSPIGVAQEVDVCIEELDGTPVSWRSICLNTNHSGELILPPIDPIGRYQTQV